LLIKNANANVQQSISVLASHFFGVRYAIFIVLNAEHALQYITINLWAFYELVQNLLITYSMKLLRFSALLFLTLF